MRQCHHCKLWRQYKRSHWNTKHTHTDNVPIFQQAWSSTSKIKISRKNWLCKKKKKKKKWTKAACDQQKPIQTCSTSAREYNVFMDSWGSYLTGEAAVPSGTSALLHLQGSTQSRVPVLCDFHGNVADPTIRYVTFYNRLSKLWGSHVVWWGGGALTH